LWETVPRDVESADREGMEEETKKIYGEEELWD
jgi:hypothetical protein